MNEHEHHEELIKEVAEAYSEIFENSEQGIYIYLDDNHKVCNEKFAQMLGFTTSKEWAQPAEFIETFVAERSGKNLVSSYQNAMEKMVGSAFEVTWKKKTGEEINSKVILVPIVVKDHLFALHFISPD